MKIVDKKLLFVSSSERDSGTIADFYLSLPSHLVTCRSHQRLRMILNDLVLPYTWFNVQETNRTFEVVENGTAFTVTLTKGSYNALQLRDHLIVVLNAASAGSGQSYTYAVTFNDIDTKYSFSIDAPVVALGANSITCAGPSHKLLGFAKAAVNTFVGSSLTSSHSISTIFTDALLLHSDLPNTNVDKGTGLKQTFHLSNVFAKIPINTSPFNNIIFENQNDDYLLNIPDRTVTQMRFYFTTVEHESIVLNDEFSFTLKVEVVEDDEKTLVEQNSGLGELLRLLVMQQHHQITQSKK